MVILDNGGARAKVSERGDGVDATDAQDGQERAKGPSR